MLTVCRCPACGGVRLQAFRAHVSPFIIARIGQKRPEGGATFVRCRTCHFAFYNPRLEESEIALLYRGYRDCAYQRLRQRFEPGYTEAINQSLGWDPEELRNRRQNAAELIQRHAPSSGIASILDFGGDRGQFIPDTFAGARRYVYEISGLPPLDGITAVSSPAVFVGRRLDVIMCCHVLEHVPDPLGVLAEIRPLGDGKTLFYIEVPLDGPFVPPRAGAPALVRIRYLVCRMPPVLKLAQRLLGRPEFIMHEHINAFTLDALAGLVKRAGFNILETRERRIALERGEARIGCCICLLSA